MEAPATSTRLSSMADNTYFVLGAYFFAFFPWAVMNNIDFITDKWRTIRRTRTLAFIHILSSVVPVLYVAVYAEAQRRDKDSKELGAAMAALMFNLIQLLRTLMGKVQLDAFIVWCKDAKECLQALQGINEETRCGRWCARKFATLVDSVRVNNTVVDNELGGRDVTVLPCWGKIWNGLKKGQFKPSKWLETDLPELCTIRWCAAYLCGLGGGWRSVNADFRANVGDARNKLELFFSIEMWGALNGLQFVTWNTDENKDSSEVVSIKCLGVDSDRVDLRGEMSTAYGSLFPDYYVDCTWSVDSYSFEVDSLVSSYPAGSNYSGDRNREGVTVGLVHSLILAKHLGVEKLKGIRYYYDRYKVPKRGILGKALKLYFKQTVDDISDELKIFETFCGGYAVDIPLFPHVMQLIALWEKSTNWRVLQASAHADIEFSLSDRDRRLVSLCQAESEPCDVFDHCFNIAGDVFEKEKKPGCAGVVLETVRSFLAEWVITTSQEADWEPLVPMEPFEFSIPPNILNGTEDDLRHKIVWVCQQVLQEEVARISTEHSSLSANNALIMLFMLGCPRLQMDEVQDTQAGKHSNDSGGGESSLPKSRFDRIVRVSNRVWRVTSDLTPQNIWIEVEIDMDTYRCSVRLKTGENLSRFNWQDWVDAVMGFMAGYNERRRGKVKYDRKIRRADLREQTVELCPLRMDSEETVIKTRCVRVWLGWPPFDVHICKSEIEQWLNACDIDLATHRLVPDRHLRKLEEVDEEIRRAEKVIESVALGQWNELKDRLREEPEIMVDIATVANR